MPVDSCTCHHCVSACQRVPGLFHPVDALRAIRAGHADDIMMRWEETDHKRGRKREQWRVLMPLSRHVSLGREVDQYRRNDPFESMGRCVFLNVDHRCEIHDSGFKPKECRDSLLCRHKGESSHEDVATAWRGPVGAFVIDVWKRELERVGL